jgi:hypothetical protein
MNEAKAAMDTSDQQINCGTLRPSTSLQELFAPLSVPANVQAPSRSSSLSSFDLSTLTAEKSGVSRLDRRLARKAEAYERARELAISLSDERDEAKEERKRFGNCFAILSVMLSFLNLVPLGVVPMEVQEAMFVGSKLSVSLKSEMFRCSCYFLIGACCPMWLELLISTSLFLLDEGGMKGEDKRDGHKATSLSTSMGDIVSSWTVLTAVMVPYFVILSWSSSSHTEAHAYTHEAMYCAISYWQYSVVESIAVSYAIRHLELHYINTTRWKQLIMMFCSAWGTNLAGRVFESFSNAGGASYFKVIVGLHAVAGFLYVLLMGLYLLTVVGGWGGWSRMGLTERYDFLSVCTVALFALIFMSTKWAIQGSYSENFDLSELDVRTLTFKTYALFVLVCPIGFFFPARLLQINHIIARNSLRVLSKGLVDDEGAGETKDDSDGEV